MVFLFLEAQKIALEEDPVYKKNKKSSDNTVLFNVPTTTFSETLKLLFHFSQVCFRVLYRCPTYQILWHVIILAWNYITWLNFWLIATLQKQPNLISQKILFELQPKLLVLSKSAMGIENKNGQLTYPNLWIKSYVLQLFEMEHPSTFQGVLHHWQKCVLLIDFLTPFWQTLFHSKLIFYHYGEMGLMENQKRQWFCEIALEKIKILCILMVVLCTLYKKINC